MKKLSKVLLLLCLLVLAIVAVTACGGDKVLSFKEDRMPQLVHVLGEELDLSGGVLQLTSGGETEDIPMDTEGIEISGYDKNTLGEQTVTVKYGGCETTVKVTVVPRMTADNLTADYLVGDTLDTTKGAFRITRNDGTSFSVVLSNAKISVEGFNTESAGEKTLTAKYTNGSTVYECDFKINVHAIETVVFTAPTKDTYNSHDGKLDVSGGYFTVSGKGGAVTKDVPLTADMVEGFDINAVNEANTPLEQTLTVSYGGKQESFKVNLVYTDVSLFKKNAQPLLSLTWSEKYEDILADEDYVPQYTEAQGVNAILMMQKYFELSPAERTFITTAETLAVARTAMAYGFEAWADEINQYSGAFAIEYGEVAWKCESREALEAAIEGLSDETTPLYTYSPVLLDMIEAFAEETVYSDITFSAYPVLDSEYYPSMIELFEYMVELDGIADAVGTDWKTDITVYADEIEAVYAAITDSDYYSYEFAQFFYLVSMWRADDDMFDFLYSYYYGVKEDTSAVLNIANIRLPSELEEVFAYIYQAMSIMSYISDDHYFLQFPDTTEFFRSYYMAKQLSEEIVNSENPDDEMIQVLYYALPLNSMLGISAEEGIYTFNDILNYINTAQGGYYSLCGALLGTDGFDALMNKYMEIIIKIEGSETYMDSADYVVDVKAMFALYTELTPSEQFNFLGILSTYYVRGYMPLAFDNVTEGFDQISTVFVDMINSVYTDLFEGEDAKNAYLQLVFASEIYAQRYIYSALNPESDKTWLSDFTERMNAVTAALGTMSDADKAIFNTELGALYTTYLGILEDYSGTDSDEIQLGDFADDFAELHEAVLNLELAYAILSEGVNYYDMFFAAYERVIAISERILKDPLLTDELREYFIYSEIYSTSSLDKMIDPEFTIAPEDEVFWSYDYVISVYRSMYVNALLTLGGGVSLYDYYQLYGFSDFMNKSYDLIWAYMGSEKDATDMFEKDKVLDIMKDFSKMDVNAQMMFILYIEGEYGLYYDAITEFLAEEFSVNVADAGELLIALEMNAIIYNYYSFLAENSADVTDAERAEIEAALEEAAEALTASYAELADAIEALSDTEEAEFNAAFSEIFATYKAVADSLTPTPAP